MPLLQEALQMTGNDVRYTLSERVEKQNLQYNFIFV